MSSQERYRQILSMLDDLLEDDDALQQLVDGARRHHAKTHHLSGIEGAAGCALGIGSRALRTSHGRRAIKQKPASSYFIDDEHAKDAIFDVIASGRTSAGKPNLYSLAGFLAREDIPAGETMKLNFYTSAYEQDPYVYGYTILKDPSPKTPQGRNGSIQEVAATNVTIVIEKGSGFGEFSIYNMYPTIAHTRENDVTPPKKFQQKLEKTNAYKIQPQVRQIETSLRIWQDEDTPSVYVQDAKLWIDFEKVGGPLVGVSKDGIESPSINTEEGILSSMRQNKLDKQADALKKLKEAWLTPEERMPLPEIIMQPRGHGSVELEI